MRNMSIAIGVRAMTGIADDYDIRTPSSIIFGFFVVSLDIPTGVKVESYATTSFVIYMYAIAVIVFEFFGGTR